MRDKNILSRLKLPDMSALRQILASRNVQDRLGGWGITLSLLAGMYLLAAWSDVSPSEYTSRILTFTSVAIPPPPPPPPVPVEASPAESEAPEVTVEEVSLPVRESISLQPPAGLDSNPERTSLAESRLAINDGGQLSALPESRLALDRSPSGTEIAAARGIQGRSRISLPGTRLALPSDQLSAGGPAGANSSMRGPASEVPSERVGAEAPEIRAFDESMLSGGGGRDNVTSAIMEWVKNNPHPHPAVVRVHLDHASGDHTAIASSAIDGREVQFYLLVRSGYDQLQVVMVDGEDSYLFFDRGLQKEVSRFRVGRVTHNDGRIARIISQEREITSEEAKAFYAAFIDWWETVVEAEK